mgnify:CR=1 FL=1
MYENSNRIFLWRFKTAVSKAGNEYMTMSLSLEDIENIKKYADPKWGFTAMVGKSQKTGLPYLSYTPREDLPPMNKSIHDSSPF